MDQLNWSWILVALTVPPLAGGLLAFPFWRRDQAIFGNIFGTVIIFGAAFGLIMREHITLDRLIQQCLESGQEICSPSPSPFFRFAVYAFIALFQVIALFSLSLRVDEKTRRRGYAPEWR
jgi:TRAP-type mannitol/chloroaromatic compound transport system permease small subunit